MIKVGLCGLGFMGRTHFSIYEKSGNARVVGLMDLDEKRRNGDWSDPIGNLEADWPTRVDMTGRKGYASVDELLADPDVDLIDITLPTHVHADIAVKALAAGKHVLCEKPMALNVEDCRRVVEQAEKSDGFFMVAHCIRFWPQYRKIRELVQSGRFGEPRSASFARLASAPAYSKGSWLMNAELSGGAIFDLHIHDIDFALYLFGRPESVYAQGTSGPSGGVDHVKATWQYPRELLVSVEGGWCYPPAFPFQMFARIRCETGTVQWDMAAGQEVVIYTGDGAEEKIQVKPSTGWDEEIEYFLSCLEENRKPDVVTAQSSMEAVELAGAEFKSVKTGNKVSLP